MGNELSKTEATWTAAGCAAPLTPELRALLHREADGDLSVDEQAALDAASLDPQVQEARRSLRGAVALLTGPNPPAPRSVADAVVADLRLRQQLAAPVLSPTLAHTLASDVSRDIARDAALERALTPPPLPHSLAASLSRDIAFSQQLHRQLAASPLPPVPPLAPALASEIASDARTRSALQGSPTPSLPRSLAASLAGRIAQEASDVPRASVVQQASPQASPQVVAALHAAAPTPAFAQAAPRTSRAPLLLVSALLAGLTLLTVTAAWPNLAAGALVLQTVLEHVAPVAGLGLLLLLLTSALVTWMPTPAVRRFGAGAFVLAGVLTLPPLYGVVNGEPGLSFGRPVEVQGLVKGNVIAIGGDVILQPGAEVEGRVVTLLGDIKQAPGARVHGEMSAVLGHTPGESAAAGAVPAPQGVQLATAAAFRPLVGWLSAAAWPQIFVALTGGLLLLLFVAGTAPVLARRQRHAPMRTLALGVLMLAALLLPALALTFAGLLGAGLLVLALAGLLIATGLSVTVYDLGRALACRLRLPVPDTVGAFLGISLVAGSLSWAPLAFALALVGGAWGAGTLFLQRQTGEAGRTRAAL